jgi:glutaredoxin-like protein
MPLLDQTTRTQISDILAPIQTHLELIVYTTGPLTLPDQTESGLQDETRQMLGELVELNDKLSLIERSILSDPEARALGLNLAPTILLREAGSNRHNIRLLGLPSGYEFRTLLEALLMLGTGRLSLGERTRAEVSSIGHPMRMQVFVTPTCPYCPKAVLTAFEFAYTNPAIIAEGIEANEFPRLSSHHGISSVPDTIITNPNSTFTATRVLGAQPDRAFVEALLEVTRVSA